MAEQQDGAPTQGIKRVHTDLGNKQQRLLRVDQIYSRKDRQIHFVKTAKAKSDPDRADKTALVVRRIITRKGVVGSTEVDIKSEPLAQAMRDFYQDAEGLALNKTPPMAEPAHFFHARQYLWKVKEQEKQKVEPSQALVDDFGAALRFIDEDFGSSIADLATLLPQGEITYELLWALFPIHERVFVPRHGELGNKQAIYLRAVEYCKRENGTLYLNVCGDLLTHDGENFGRGMILVEVDSFPGTKRIATLAAFPLKFHPEALSIEEALIKRGKRYISLIKQPSYEDYTGSFALKTYEAPDGTISKVKVAANGRSMIDPTAFSYYAQMRTLTRPYVSEENAINTFDNLTDEQYLICAWWANGFCFATKVWAQFEVAKFVNVKWMDDAFSKIVVNEKWRRIVHGLVRAHRNAESSFDDIIQNKGKGMVGLLSGNPGVGKTATAEAVAEVTHRPLYQASGGELGMEPDKVDDRLESILEITRRWSAVLLIDEADVFLATRGKSIAQDTLVSIFLRRIEYFQGVLILTTNRDEEIDHAFRSRIHFRLHYPDLDEAKRLHIWKIFLTGQSDVVDLDDNDMSQLSKRVLNGREIKNATSCIVSLARLEKQRIGINEVNEVLDVIFGQASVL